MVVGHWLGVMVLVAAVPPAQASRRGRERDVVAVAIEHAADAAEAVVGEEVEELVLDDGAADRAAKLVLLMDGLGEQERCGAVVQGLELVVGVERVERGVTQRVEEIAVDVVGAALGDGVDLAAGGLTELDGVVGGFGLELLDGVGRVDVRRTRGTATSFREEHLVVVGAVDVVLVVEAADAVEADEAGAAVLDDVGGEEHKGVPVAGGDGQIRNELLVEGLGDFSLFRVEDGRFAGDVDIGVDGAGG